MIVIPTTAYLMVRSHKREKEQDDHESTKIEVMTWSGEREITLIFASVK